LCQYETLADAVNVDKKGLFSQALKRSIN